MRITKRWRVRRLSVDGVVRERVDVLAGEEPLEIRVGGRPYAVTMRTPGHDVELAAGFLVSEGVVARADDVHAMDDRSGVTPTGERDRNVLDVRLAPGVPLPAENRHRHVYTTSSCGVCGTASIDAVRTVSRFVPADDDVVVPLRVLLALPERLRAEQAVFGRTGGVHAAALLSLPPDARPDDGAPGPASADGDLLCVREDVGRHNAVDKVVGWALLAGRLPLRRTVLQVSGRASFELVQKAAMAGIPVLSAVSAPSALAVELGAELGVTVVGFNRGDTLNVYSRPERVGHPHPHP